MIDRKNLHAAALFSGGLDSMLSVKLMLDLGYRVTPIFFKTPFFGAEKAEKAAEELGLKLLVHDITESHLQMVKNPRYGYGKYMNPCIDCHALMFQKAGELTDAYGYDFLISGEVLGQRPMSQRRDALNAVSKLSSVKELIVRPLSQKLLADTKPISEGWIDKDELLDIQGRSRQRQLELAEQYGFQYYSTPGGGCLLTDKSFSIRLRDLMDYEMMELDSIELLKVGRHFRINEDIKIIIGKNKFDNKRISELIRDKTILYVKYKPGPLGVLDVKREPTEAELKLAASILSRYVSDYHTGDIVEVTIKDSSNDIKAVPLSADKCNEYMIKMKD
jgi:tRNA U34 2-thiouridine synthase MnmA/TrmU